MSSVGLTAFQLRYVNKAFWRNPASAFFTFALPLMFLVIFTALLGRGQVRLGGREVHQSTYYVAQMAAFAVITACYDNLAIGLTFQRDTGVLKRTNGTPMPSSVYFAARVLHALLVSVLLVTITVIFGKVAYQADVPSSAALARFLVMLLRQRHADRLPRHGLPLDRRPRRRPLGVRRAGRGAALVQLGAEDLRGHRGRHRLADQQGHRVQRPDRARRLLPLGTRPDGVHHRWGTGHPHHAGNQLRRSAH